MPKPLITHLYFSGTSLPLIIGDNTTIFRARMEHNGGANNPVMVFQRSTDSGTTWADHFTLNLQTGFINLGPGGHLNGSSVGAAGEIYVQNQDGAEFADSGIPDPTLGATGSTYRQTDTGDFWNRLAAGWSLVTNFFFKTANGIRTSNRVGINVDASASADLATDGDIIDGGLTAHLPVKTAPASKTLISALIDVTSANDVTVPITGGNFLISSGGVVAGVSHGVAVSFTEITSGPNAATIQYKDWSGVNQSATFLTGFGVATHTSDANGLVNS